MLLLDGRLRPVLRAGIFLIGAVFLGGVLGFAVASAMHVDLSGLHGSVGALLFAQELGLCAAVVALSFIMRRDLDRRSWTSLGLNLDRRSFALLAFGFALGAAMQSAIFAIDASLGYSHVQGIATPAQDAGILLVYIPVFILVAVTEELALRGYVFQNLWEEWGAPAAVVFTSLLFAAIHLGNPNSHANVVLTLVGLIAYGVCACASVIWTKSLMPAIGVHFAWNLFEGPVYGFPVSGIDFSSTAIRQSVQGPVWFTGGAFGPESGASALVALALGFIVLWWLHRRGAFAGAPDVREAYARRQKSSSPSSEANSSSSSP